MVNFKKIFFYIFLLFFSLFDFITLFLIRILNKKIIYKLIKNKFLISNIKFKTRKKNLIRKFLKDAIFIRSKSLYFFSTCLSRAIIGSVILNLFEIPNSIELGFQVDSEKKKFLMQG